MRKQILLVGIVCLCIALLLATPCLAAQPVKKCDLKIDKIKGECHAGEEIVISGKTRNIPDGYQLELNFEHPQKSVVPLPAYVVDNRYTATVHTDYLGEGTWSVWTSTPWVGFPPWDLPDYAESKRVSLTVLP